MHPLSRLLPATRPLGRLPTRILAGTMLVGALALAAAAGLDREAAEQRLARLVAAPLEGLHGPAELSDPQTLTGLVVLGGGVERLREAGRLARAFPHLRVFVSSAGAVDHVLRELGPGIARERIDIETISRSTYDNARNSHRMLRPTRDERWLLVTSAVHMPRSMAAFQRLDFPVEAWPVFDFGRMGRHSLEVATHEWVGIAWYWLRARSEALLAILPAPTTGSVARPPAGGGPTGA